MEQNLTNFIKYCLGYINITRQQGLRSQQKDSVELLEEYFNLEELLNKDSDDKNKEVINLENFYNLDPKDVSEELLDEYNKEKEKAKQIELVYNKFKNDQYRKQTLLHFGYFEIELPAEENQEDEEEASEENNEEMLAIKQGPLFEEDNKKEKKTKAKENKHEKHPLFTVQIKVDKEGGKYYVYATDAEIKININPLEAVLGEELYYQLLEEFGQYEMDGKISIPFVNLNIFIEIWHKVKSQLKLKDVIFNEESFSLKEVRISIGAKANFFLAEDLRKLADVSDLEDTALDSWVKDVDLNICDDESQLGQTYFPFAYDKHQLRILSLLRNKAFIVEGPPGTGKSQTISNLLCHLAANGNRVLFVSQKAQALKVVKDRLKTLKVDYLFGYIPNPNSAQLNEIDEMDGVAPQLSGINSHIEKLIHAAAYRKNESSVEGVTKAANRNIELCSQFNIAIELQRRLFKLEQKLAELKEYDLPINRIEKFGENFSKRTWKEIKKLKVGIEELQNSILKYDKSAEKRKHDKNFSCVDLTGETYTQLVDLLIEDISKTGFDRHSRVARKLNNSLRKIRLREIRKGLPREIIDVIDGLLNEDISRKQALKELHSLSDYCKYHELKEYLSQCLSALDELLINSGLSNEQFDLIDEKIINSSFDKIREKIIKVKEIQAEIESLTFKDQNLLSEQIRGAKDNKNNVVAGYLKNIINANILNNYNLSVDIRRKVKMLAKAFSKSKQAFKTFDKIRSDSDNFKAILDLIPIWIMELDDASRLVPLEAGIFDYVVLDEASQCNVAYTLPVMFRSKHAIFVGDSEQMRDNTIMFKSNKSFDELAKRYQIPEQLRIKSSGSSVQSVLDIANLRGFQSRALTYHYRSPKELIGFSNENFYKRNGKELVSLNSNYLTYEDTNRVMLVHQVDSDPKKEFSDQTSLAEAEAIVEMFKKIKDDKKYLDKSIAILTFFNAQAICIRELLEKESYKEERDNYIVSIIDGIQGDEKDIVMYSFVIRDKVQKKMYVPLTGEGGDVQREINMGRVNVAFSRAKLQVHCFSSMPIEDIPDKIWIKKYLKYVKENGEVQACSDELKDFDSYFEEEFYALMKAKLDKKYVIQNQVESCGFKIDFVITNTKTGKRVAVECDGPTHFRDELDDELGIYVDSDQERQGVLEAAGWDFYRIRYSAWINDQFNKESVYLDIVELLK